MKVVTSEYGKTKDGVQAHLYTIKNKNGMTLVLSDYGAVIESIIVPDKNGKPVNVVLGYDNLSGYENDTESFGAFVGRNANRIAGAKFSINGETYNLEKNDGENNLHSGNTRSNKMMYEAETMEDVDMASVEFSRLFPDMEQGFPGNCDITVTYSLTENNEVIIEYFAASDKDTVVNLTNHSYFNLNGGGTILDHKVKILADSYTAAGAELVPTGEILPVAGTPFDFNELKPLRQDINADFEPIKYQMGYDQNFVLHGKKGEVDYCAECIGDKSGIKMEVFTDLPGIQLYSGNFLNGVKGRNGAVYNKQDGVCFETQLFPNSINIPAFQSSLLPAGKEYETTTIYKFGLE